MKKFVLCVPGAGAMIKISADRPRILNCENMRQPRKLSNIVNAQEERIDGNFTLVDRFRSGLLFFVAYGLDRLKRQKPWGPGLHRQFRCGWRKRIASRERLKRFKMFLVE